MEPLLIVLIPGVIGGAPGSSLPRALAGSTGRCRARRAARPAVAVSWRDQHRAHPDRWRRRAGHGGDGHGRGDFRSLDSTLGLARTGARGRRGRGADYLAAFRTADVEQPPWRRPLRLMVLGRPRLATSAPCRFLPAVFDQAAGSAGSPASSALTLDRLGQPRIVRLRRHHYWSDTWTLFMKLATC